MGIFPRTLMALALLFGAVAPSWASTATDHLESALRLMREEAVPRAAALNGAIRAGYETGFPSGEMGARAGEYMATLARVRQEIQASFPSIVASEHPVLLSVAMDYFRCLEVLHVARSSADGLFTLARPFSNVSDARLNDLRLSLPDVLAQRLREAVLALAREAPHDNIPDLTVAANPAASGESFIDFSATMRRRFIGAALALRPSARLLSDSLRTQAISMTFMHMAQMRNHLPHRLRPSVSFPSSLSRQDRDFMELQYEEAERTAREQNYRPLFIRAALDPLVTHVRESARGRAYNVATRQLVQRLRRDFRAHLDPAKSRIPLAAVVGSIRSAIEYDHEEGEDRFWRTNIYAGLVNSSRRFHLLGGDALDAALADVMSEPGAATASFMLGCLMFRDGAGTASVCNGGETEASIYNADMGWTPAELADYNEALRQYFRELLNPLPPDLKQSLEHLHSMSDVVSSARARYMLAAQLLEGARALKLMDDTRQAIARETGRTMAEESMLPFNRQSTIADRHFLNHEINPGLVALAMANNNFLQTEVAVHQWHGEVLAHYAGLSANERTTPARRRALRLLLTGRNNVADELDNHVAEIVTAIGGVAGRTSVRERAEAAREARGDCSGANALANFMDCMPTFGRWARRSGEGIWNHITDSEEETRPATELTITPNPALGRLQAGYRGLKARRGTRMMGTGAMRSALERTMRRGGIANSPELRILNHFKELADSAEALHSDGLTAEVDNAFKALVERSDIFPLMALRQGIHDFRRLLVSQHAFVDAIFQRAEAMRLQMRPFLRRRMVYEAYLNQWVQALEFRMPALFFELQAPSGIRSSIENEGGIPLYSVIASVKAQVGRGGYVQALQDAQRRIQGLGGFTRIDGSNDAAVGTLSIDTITRQAFAGLRDHAGILQQFIREGFPSMCIPGTEICTPAMEGVSRRGLSDDSWWPEGQFHLSDFAPSVDDNFFLEHCDSGPVNAETCRQRERLARVITSVLIQPYLRSALAGDRVALNDLVSTSADPQTRRRALLQSAALDALNAETHGAVAGGATRMSSRILFWDHWLEESRGRLATINQAIFQVYMFSMLGPQESIPFSIHRFSSLAMFLPAFSETIMGWALARQYRNNFLALVPYGRSAMLPGGLVRGNVIAGMEERFNSHVSDLGHRLPFELMWYTGMLHGVIARTSVGQRFYEWRNGRAVERMMDGRPSQGNTPYNDMGRTRAEVRMEFGQDTTARGARYMADCEVLGIAPGEYRLSVIRHNYREAIKRLHPDRGGAVDNNSEGFRRIDGAYRRMLHALRQSSLLDERSPLPAEIRGSAIEGEAPAVTADTRGTGARVRDGVVEFLGLAGARRVGPTPTPVEVEAFRALDIMPGSRMSDARAAYRSLRAELIEARASARRVRRAARTRDEIRHAQSDINNLNRGITELNASWRRVQAYYRAAGGAISAPSTSVVAPSAIDMPGRRDMDAAFTRLGIQGGEPFAQVRSRYNQALEAARAEPEGEARTARIESLESDWRQVSQYFDRLSASGVDAVSLRAPQWIGRLPAPEAPRAAPETAASGSGSSSGSGEPIGLLPADASPTDYSVRGDPPVMVPRPE